MGLTQIFHVGLTQIFQLFHSAEAPTREGLGPGCAQRAAMIYAGYERVEAIDEQLSRGMVGLKRDESYAQFVAGAYRARTAYQPFLDLMYGPGDRQRLDYFPTPRGSANAPTIIFFHGGNWRLSDKFFANFWAEAFCPAGFNFIAATYGFLPLTPLEQIIDHARLAVAWVHGQADQLAIDPTRLILGGNSAGAHLAAMAALHDWSHTSLDPAHLRGIFGFSGLYDLELLHHSTFSRPYIPTVEAARAWSPVHHVRPGLPPAFWVYGDEETPEFARQTNGLHEAWEGAGNRSVVHVALGGNHYNPQWFARTPGNPLHTRLISFLRSL